jgi:predicted O-methyltransferase YrrM
MKWLDRDNESSTENESKLIGALVKAIEPKVCVETGTHTGCTTKEISIAKTKEGRLWTYDIEECDFEDDGIVNYVKGDSSKAVMPKKIDFAFLDACHETEFVIREFNHIKKNLNDGAVVVFHDYIPTDPGYVTEAIRRLGLNVIYIPTYYGMGIYYHNPVVIHSIDE